MARRSAFRRSAPRAAWRLRDRFARSRFRRRLLRDGLLRRSRRTLAHAGATRGAAPLHLMFLAERGGVGLQLGLELRAQPGRLVEMLLHPLHQLVIVVVAVGLEVEVGRHLLQTLVADGLHVLL